MIRRADWVRRVGLWLCGSGVGTAIIMLPDRGDRLFSFSAAHGPGTTDMVGIAILLISWLPILLLLWTGRKDIGARPAAAAIVAGSIGALLLTAGIAADRGSGWVIGVGFLVGAHALALAGLWRRAME